MSGPYPFEPDWTLAPAAMLQELMTERNQTRGTLAKACGRGEADIKALLLIDEVLARKPLQLAHAELLQRGTGISAAFWLNYERIYRDGLAAGCADATES